MLGLDKLSIDGGSTGKMFKLMKKKGMSTKIINTAIIGILLVVVLFKMYAVLIPEVQTAGNELNESGAPLGSLFAGNNGVVVLLIMIALVLVIVKSFMGHTKK